MCKVRRISEDRSIFLLKDIIKLPEIDIRDQPNSVSFVANAKPAHPNALLSLTLKAHKEGVKTHWLSEINNYSNDPLTLNEHNADDLRIDPTAVKPDEFTGTEDVIRLHRKASYESDGIKPSEVAKDHFLTPEEREHYAKQLAEEQQLLQLQQKSFVQRNCQQVSSVSTEIKSDGVVTQTKVVEQSREEIVSTKGADERHAKLVRSTAIQRSEEIEVQDSVQQQQQQQTSSVIKVITSSNENKQQQKHVEASSTTNTSTTAVSTKAQVSFDEKSCAKSRIEESSKTTVVGSGNTTTTVSHIDEPKPLHENTATASAYTAYTADAGDNNNIHVEISTANIVDACPITILSDANNPGIHVHTVEQQLALCTPSPSSRTNTAPHDGGGTSGDGQSKSNGTINNTSSASGNTGRSTIVWDAAGNRLQTISRFCFRDRDDSGPPGLPPVSNVPDFLIPRHLITYETSFEVHVRKIPNPLPPPPPPPPCYIKKLLIHTESLEERTRAVLSGKFESGPTDASLRTARRKIRLLNSTILKSDDEVNHAKDTIHKAQSKDFLRISNPPIIAKPQYEFIEVPSERSEEECSELSERRSERGISEIAQGGQQQENMEDYYTSKYSSRSSRRQVEGESFTHSFIKTSFAINIF